MDSHDNVDPVDAELNNVLGHLADNARDQRSRDRILDLMLTVPSVNDWPPEFIEEWRALQSDIRNARRDLELRELRRISDADGTHKRHHPIQTAAAQRRLGS